MKPSGAPSDRFRFPEPPADLSARIMERLRRAERRRRRIEAILTGTGFAAGIAGIAAVARWALKAEGRATESPMAGPGRMADAGSRNLLPAPAPEDATYGEGTHSARRSRARTAVRRSDHPPKNRLAAQITRQSRSDARHLDRRIRLLQEPPQKTTGPCSFSEQGPVGSVRPGSYFFAASAAFGSAFTLSEARPLTICASSFFEAS